MKDPNDASDIEGTKGKVWRWARETAALQTGDLVQKSASPKPRESTKPHDGRAFETVVEGEAHRIFTTFHRPVFLKRPHSAGNARTNSATTCQCHDAPGDGGEVCSHAIRAGRICNDPLQPVYRLSGKTTPGAFAETSCGRDTSPTVRSTNIVQALRHFAADVGDDGGAVRTPMDVGAVSEPVQDGKAKHLTRGPGEFHAAESIPHGVWGIVTGVKVSPRAARQAGDKYVFQKPAGSIEIHKQINKGRTGEGTEEPAAPFKIAEPFPKYGPEAGEIIRRDISPPKRSDRLLQRGNNNEADDDSKKGTERSEADWRRRALERREEAKRNEDHDGGGNGRSFDEPQRPKVYAGRNPLSPRYRPLKGVPGVVEEKGATEQDRLRQRNRSSDSGDTSHYGWTNPRRPDPPPSGVVVEEALPTTGGSAPCAVADVPTASVQPVADECGAGSAHSSSGSYGGFDKKAHRGVATQRTTSLNLTHEDIAGSVPSAARFLPDDVEKYAKRAEESSRSVEQLQSAATAHVQVLGGVSEAEQRSQGMSVTGRSIRLLSKGHKPVAVVTSPRFPAAAAAATSSSGANPHRHPQRPQTALVGGSNDGITARAVQAPATSRGATEHYGHSKAFTEVGRAVNGAAATNPVMPMYNYDRGFSAAAVPLVAKFTDGGKIQRRRPVSAGAVERLRQNKAADVCSVRNLPNFS